MEKTGSVEDGPAKIVTFTQAVDDFEEPQIFAYLNEVEPDFDNLLYGYWDVELKNFTPVRYGGVVSTISKIPSAMPDFQNFSKRSQYMTKMSSPRRKPGSSVFNVRGRRHWFPAFAGMTMAKNRIFVVYYTKRYKL